MTLAEIRTKNRAKSTRLSVILAKELEDYDITKVPPELVKSQRSFFEEVVRPHSREMFGKYVANK